MTIEKVHPKIRFEQSFRLGLSTFFSEVRMQLFFHQHLETYQRKAIVIIYQYLTSLVPVFDVLYLFSSYIDMVQLPVAMTVL